MGGAGGAEEVEGVLGSFELGVDDGGFGCFSKLLGEVSSLFDRGEGVAVAVDDEEGGRPGVDLIEVSSTTRAAEIAKEEPGAAALGGKLAAEFYGLKILEPSINDRTTNTTRFLVLSHNTCPATGNDRTSIMFSVRDRPGSHFSALKPFNEFEINMSKIESRPSKRRDWEYFFFVDVLGHCEEKKLITALDELGEHCSFVKILGSYPNTEG